MSTSRIVTLAQLALLPRGTMVACIRMNEQNQVVHDCQGIVEVGPVHKIGHVSEEWVNLHPMLPDVQIIEGVVEDSYEPTCIARENRHDHRFVVYDADAINNPKNHRARWRS